MQHLGVLACPDCRSTLKSLSSCECGSTFDSDGGTPRLFPSRGEASFEYRFTKSRAVKNGSFEKAFTYPPEAPALDIYHMDPAHLKVLQDLPKGSTVLEVGCGGAQMRELVTMLGHAYIGTDISKTRVYAFLQAHGGADILCDAHFLPIAENSIDLVYSVATTEHLACPQLVARNIFRALKPGGLYLGNGSFMEPWHDDSFSHLSPLGVFELLTQADFEALYIWPGRGWSGYQALMAMGNRATQLLRFIGSGVNLAYLASGKLKRNGSRIVAEARVSGAIDWIARKPHGSVASP